MEQNKCCATKNDKKDKGASLVEYALLVALIAVACIAAITLLSTGISKTFSETANSIN